MVKALELGQSDAPRPHDLIPGHPPAIRASAQKFAELGTGLRQTADGVKRQNMPNRHEPGDTFRTTFSDPQPGLAVAAEALISMAKALDAHADVVDNAQQQVPGIVELWTQGDQLNDDWNTAWGIYQSKMKAYKVGDPTPIPPSPVPPGNTPHNEARSKLRDARARVAHSAATTAAVFAECAELVPALPDWLHRTNRDLLEAGRMAFDDEM